MTLPWLVIIPISPSRAFIDWWKERTDDRHERGNKLRTWSFLLFVIEALSCFILAFAVTTPTDFGFSWIALVSLLYAWSRINEISIAFYSDALSKDKKSDLTATERIRMAMRSYFGLAFNFSLAYYFIPVCHLFKDGAIASYWEAFYFSGVTLATLGYGDILPIHALSRLLALYEVFAGVLIVAVAIATYAGDRDA